MSGFLRKTRYSTHRRSIAGKPFVAAEQVNGGFCCTVSGPCTGEDRILLSQTVNFTKNILGVGGHAKKINIFLFFYFLAQRLLGVASWDKNSKVRTEETRNTV